MDGENEHNIEYWDRMFALRIRGIRKAVDLLLEKTGVKFCMRCFEEIKGEVYVIEATDILGEKRRLTLCEKCCGESKLASRDAVP